MELCALASRFERSFNELELIHLAGLDLQTEFYFANVTARLHQTLDTESTHESTLYARCPGHDHQ